MKKTILFLMIIVLWTILDKNYKDGGFFGSTGWYYTMGNDDNDRVSVFDPCGTYIIGDRVELIKHETNLGVYWEVKKAK